MSFLRMCQSIYIIAVYIVCAILLLCIQNVVSVGEAVWAVNCGGEAHTDVHGINYQRDYLGSGTPSDFGRGLNIQRVHPQDQILYQTERYNLDTFGYEIPVKKDGDYVLVLKFSEVWFNAASQKVFDILLNGEHVIVDQLDIYNEVGRGVAHDEVIPFTVKNKQLHVLDQKSYIENSRVRVDFIKGDLDNPKINAIYLMKGTIDDVPMLPPLPYAQNDNERMNDEDEEMDFQVPLNRRKVAGEPKVADPYETDDTSLTLLPVLVALGLFIPLVFCLCRL